MGRITREAIVFPPPPVARIQYPTIETYNKCSFNCMSGDPQCGCWNDFGILLHYFQPKFLDHKEGKFPS